MSSTLDPSSRLPSFEVLEPRLLLSGVDESGQALLQGLSESFNSSEMDFGDAPDSPLAPGYPTLAGNNGASHIIGGPWLGDDNAKWVQLPDLTTYGIDIKADGMDPPRVLADDFLCEQTSLLTDVHLWGSWLHDIEGEITNVHLSIHEDDPVGDEGMRKDNEWSMPGELLWEGDFNNYEMTPFYELSEGFEWWWDPITGKLIPDGDRQVWQLDVQIDPLRAFVQRGTPDEPVIYWLDVHVDVAPVPGGEQPEFGWKTRQWPDHFMDDAVWWDGVGWKDMHYPPGHPYELTAQNSIDMAFMLTFEELTTEVDVFPEKVGQLLLELPGPNGIQTTSPQLPPTEGYYRSAAQQHAEYVSPDMMVVLENLIHRPLGDAERSMVGTDEHESFQSLALGTATLMMGGEVLPRIPVELTGPVQTVVSNKGDQTTGSWDAEIVSMTLSGDMELPDGTVIPIVIRESPARSSSGQTSVIDDGDPGFYVESFFDVFTELSVDGGQNWIASTGGTRMELVQPVLVSAVGLEVVHVFFEGPMEGMAHDDDGDGLDEVDTEIVSMDLRGNSSLGLVQIGLRPDMPSLGQIIEGANYLGGVLDVSPFSTTNFPADSFFDVWTEITIGGQVFHTAGPLRLETPIAHKPPQDGERYQDPYGDRVELIDPATGEGTGIFVVRAVNQPDPTTEVDVMETTTAVVELVGGPLGPSPVPFVLHGPTEVHVFFEGPNEGDAVDDDVNGLEEVVTQMVSMNLTDGNVTMRVRDISQSPYSPSLGQIEENVNNTPGQLDLDPFHPGDADSFFDVFFEVELPGGTVLHNEQPLRVASTIDEKPPNALYVGAIPQGGIVLYTELNEPTDIRLVRAEHYTGLADLDFGDAPEVAGAVGYPTTLANNGARHAIGGPWLGDANDQPDAEPDGQPDPAALGDDLDVDGDDEDGVNIPVLTQGARTWITYEVSNVMPGGAYVDGWIDFNGDNTWDASEKVLTAVPLADQIYTFPVTPPPGSVIGRTFARFRINSRSNIGPTGGAVDGEVEDYEVRILEGVPENTKWVQWPDITPEGMDIRVNDMRWLADDFQCTETSQLTDVHLWCSWLDDAVGEIEKIHLSVHSDDPQGLGGTMPDNQYSMPDELLWEEDFHRGEFQEALYYKVPEGEYWWDPATGQLIPSADNEIWRIDINIDPALHDIFVQTGTPENPVIYWLDVQVETLDDRQIGWKTRRWPVHFMDDAVWDQGSELPRDWKEMRYPDGHRYEGYSIDMAFALTFEDVELDWGDAPQDASGAGYPTLAISNGANHAIVPGVYIGDEIDAEPDGQPSPLADGDDANPPAGPNDEDGVIFPTYIVPNMAMSMRVNASVDGFLDAWIDFNGDGSFAEPGDQIFSSRPLTAGMNYVSSSAPATATPDLWTYARYRFSTRGGLSPTGPAPDGEVEDYRVWISSSDFGDAPAPYPTAGVLHVVDQGWLGDASDRGDHEVAPQPDPAALGDDLIDGNDDEDGVSIPVLTQGVSANITFQVSGGGGFVDGWIDWNANGAWEHPGERVVTGYYGDGNYVVPVTPPAGAAIGQTFARFRINYDESITPTDVARGGEVEDHLVEILEAPDELDFGDAPELAIAMGYPTTLANNGARHVIRGPWLGDDTDKPDGERDGQPDPNALGDDNDTIYPPANDDEDGVFVSPLAPGHSGSVTVKINDGAGGTAGGAWLDAWIDFNGDMTWDASEVIQSGWLAHGSHVLTFPVPPTAVVGQTFGRFRVNSQVTALPPIGPAEDGEVEDHEVEIYALPDNAKWVQWPDLTPFGIDIKVDGEDPARVLADDFLCTETSLLTDVHLWGSWLHDIEGEITNVHLSIHEDDPVGDEGMRKDNEWSMPGELLWEGDFNNYEMTPFYELSEGFEWWWDPITGKLIPDGDRQVWQLDVQIDPLRAFVQRGTPDEPVIYWLDVHVDVEPDPSGERQPEFGWKTRQWPDHFMDDAVWWDGLGWQDLRYPQGHPYHGLEKDSIDMAFMLTFEEAPQEHDLGDAPDSTNSHGVAMIAYPDGTAANFPTVYQAGSPAYGPIHWQPRAVAFLGRGVTLENEADMGPDEDGVNNIDPSARKDDQDGRDDGVRFPLNLTHWEWNTFDFDVTDVAGGTGAPLYANAWFDWTRDGDWDDAPAFSDGTTAPEWAVQNQVIITPGPGVFTLTSDRFLAWHPNAWDKKEPIWMRITLSERPHDPIAGAPGAGGSGPANGYDYGETEDYYVETYDEDYLDYGDAPDGFGVVGYPTLRTNDGARHITGPLVLGANVDSEPDGQPDPNALGDDINDGNDDEDGVEFLSDLIAGREARVRVVASEPGVLNAWFDWGSNASWGELGDHVLVDVAIPAGGTIFNINVPAGATLGETFARFRLDSAGGLSPTGLAHDGEVEDYKVEIVEEPTLVKWNQPPDLAYPDNLFYGWNESSVHASRQIAADDWVCDNDDPITGVTWWGSFTGWTESDLPDLVFMPTSFNLAIWTDMAADDPANQYTFSHPDVAQWVYDTSLGYTAEFVGWDYDPRTESYEACFKFHADIPERYWYYQPGPENILWLSIGAVQQELTYEWGWKTRPRDSASLAPDDAVRIFVPTAPLPGQQFLSGQEITWPSPEQSWDLAFELHSVEDLAKWDQPPDLNGMDILDGPYSNINLGQVYEKFLADDFLCTQTGPITEIRVRSSYLFDESMGIPPLFNLAIYSDIPASADQYSMPGKVLWEDYLPAVREEIIDRGDEQFYDPNSQDIIGTDTLVYEYTFVIPEDQAFVQEEGNIYWLGMHHSFDLDGSGIVNVVDVAMLREMGHWAYGWKTAETQQHDGAVWTDVNSLGTSGDIPAPTGAWRLLEPFGIVTDLSFTIITPQEPEPYVKWSQPPEPYYPRTAFNGWDEYSVYGPNSPQIVADDWLCDTNDPVTDVHWLGSFIGWADGRELPATLPEAFHFAIWKDMPADDPANPWGWSHPDLLVWEHWCYDFEMEFVGWDIDPRGGGLVVPEATFSFSQDLPEENWFWQEDGENIYWISIAAVYPDGGVPEQYAFGWKTRPRDPESPAPDDAVRIFDPTQPGSWDDPYPVVDDGNIFPLPNSVNASRQIVSFPEVGAQLMQFEMVSHDLTGPVKLPRAGETFNVDSFFDITYQIEFDGAGIGAARERVGMTIRGDTAPGTFDTEIVSMNLTGGDLPPGVMLRESQSRPSTGKHSVELDPGGFHVDSFFDIFFELSVDGGRTWAPADGPLRTDFSLRHDAFVDGEPIEFPEDVSWDMVFALTSKDRTPPQVTNVAVSGSAWTIPPFSVPVGSTAQLDTLAWSNVDQVSISFSEWVSVGQEDLDLVGGYPYTVTGLAYDIITNTATFTLAQPLKAGAVLLDLTDAVIDASGNRLDGDWTDTVSVYPSGDGVAGMDFRFTVKVLPGDTDQNGTVDAGDYIALKTNIGTTSGATSATGDFDGDGDVDWYDLQILRANYGSVVPTPPAVPMGGGGGDEADVETAPETPLSSVIPAVTASTGTDGLDEARAAAALEAADPLRAFVRARQRNAAALPVAVPTPRRRAARRSQFDALLGRSRLIRVPQEPAYTAPTRQDMLTSGTGEAPPDIETDLLDVLSLSKMLGLGVEGL